MVKEVTEPVFTDKSQTDMFVPVKPASPVAFRIIQMYDFEIADIDLIIELCKGVCDSHFRAQLISRSKRVTCVKTYSWYGGDFQSRPVIAPDMLETAADTVLLSGRVLKEQYGRSVDFTEGSINRTDDTGPSSGYSVTKVMPEMSDKILDTQFPAPVSSAVRAAIDFS